MIAYRCAEDASRGVSDGTTPTRVRGFSIGRQRVAGLRRDA